MNLTETIRKFNVDYLKKSIEKMNKKCRKLGCPEMVLTFDNPTTTSFDYHPITGHRLIYPLVVEYIDAHLEYDIPMIEGWELIAKLDIFEDQVFVSAVPEKFVPAEYQNKNEIHCDHCGWNRNRHHSILLRNVETNEYKEVGSTCVKDFFGHDPKGFMFLAGIDFHEICNFKEEGMSYGRNISAYDLKDVLEISSAVTAKFGFTSKAKAYHNGLESTTEKVWDNLEPTADVMRFRKDNLIEVTDEDKENAKRTIEYFKTNENEDNDYLLNCKKLCELNYVPSKFMGFACSMVNSYLRQYEKQQEKAKLPESNWVGEVGDRIKNVRAEVVFTKNIDSYYGTSTLFVFRDANGNEYKTFYSGTKWDYEKGAVVLLTGTVKKHDEYNDRKATMLNRVVCKDAPEEAFTVDEFSIN